MKVTIKQIAEEAGVSTVTVSRVLHDPSLVKEASRKKIQSIIAKYKYSYTSPVRVKQKYIGIIIPEISNIFFAKIINSFILAFDEKFSDHELIFSYSYDSPEKEFQGLNFLLSQQCAAIIIIPSSRPLINPEFWLSQTTPIIWVERSWDSVPPRLGVLSNKETAAYEATITLAQHNIKSILLINGPVQLPTAQARTKGMEKGIQEYNLSPNQQKVLYGSFAWEHGYTSVKQEDLSQYDAIIAGNGTIAQGALQALYEKNISIPKDIAFISFDETASFHLSPISTIYFSGEEMAVELIQVLEKALVYKDFSHVYYLNAHKILRGSEFRA